MILRQSTNSPKRKVQCHQDQKWTGCWSFLWHLGDCVQRIRSGSQAVNSTYYCDVLQWQHEIVWRSCPKLWQQGYYIMAMHCLTLPYSPCTFWYCFTMYIAKINFVIPTHPIHQTRPCNFCLFPHLWTVWCLWTHVLCESHQFHMIDMIQTETWYSADALRTWLPRWI